MSGQFSIDIDAPRNLLRVRMAGFFSIEDVARYHAAIDEASAQLGGAPSRQKMLNDISEMRIQQQEVVAEFQRVMSDAKYRQRRVGFVVASSLARKQLQRIIGGRDARMFETSEQALAWLLERSQAAA